MAQPLQQDRIQRGTVSHSGVGSIGVVSTGTEADGRQLAIVALSIGDEESDLRLRPGEQFSFGDQVWELTEIDRPGDARAWVTITRIS